MDVSILICTYNSGKKIEKTLEHVFNQNGTEDIDFEVLIVDYRSTDDTLKIALDLFNGSNIPLKILNEKKQGKTPALETGLYSSKGEIICIVDDDNGIDKNYIANAYEIMKNYKDVGVIGAFGKAYCEIPQPKWFKNYLGMYAVGGQGNQSGYVTDENRKWFWGAGSVFRKEAWLKAKNNGFEPIFNPSRINDSASFVSGFSGGEDPEMCFAIQMCGYKLWYEPKLIYTHYIPKERLTKKYIIDATNGTSAAEPILRLYLAEITINEPLAMIRKILYQNYYIHCLYIYLKLFISRIRYIFSNNKNLFDREFEKYNSQIKSLYSIKSDFDKILLRIKRING